MVANQDEFVYVTWQERERHRLAHEYLERSKKHSETMKRFRKAEKDRAMELEQAHKQLELQHHGKHIEDGKSVSSGGNKSQFSFDPQKLAQPKTISYQRIHDTIVLLQTKFR